MELTSLNSLAMYGRKALHQIEVLWVVVRERLTKVWWGLQHYLFCISFPSDVGRQHCWALESAVKATEPRGTWQYWESSERVLPCLVSLCWKKAVTWENVCSKSLLLGVLVLLWDNCSSPVSQQLYGTSWGKCQPCPASLDIGMVPGLSYSGNNGLTLCCHRELLSLWQAENSSSSDTVSEIWLWTI